MIPVVEVSKHYCAHAASQQDLCQIYHNGKSEGYHTLVDGCNKRKYIKHSRNPERQVYFSSHGMIGKLSPVESEGVGMC